EEMKITDDQLRAVEKVTILACGTSWHAGLVGKFMLEPLVRVPVEVDYGSEYRYRSPIASPGTLAVVITQSGETADTLAALREAKRQGVCSISICNVVGSMATRETDGTIYTHAGPEIGVASTKAFTSQLVALYLLGLRLGQVRGVLTEESSKPHIDALLQLPLLLENTLKLAPQDHVFEKMIGNMQEVKARGGSIVALTTRGDTKLASIIDRTKDYILEVPPAPELLTPILMVLPLQLLAYDIAVRRGCDVDQ